MLSNKYCSIKVSRIPYLEVQNLYGHTVLRQNKQQYLGNMVGFVRPESWTFRQSHLTTLSSIDEIFRTCIAYSWTRSLSKYIPE